MFLDDFEPLYEISSTDLHQMYLAKRYDTGKEVIVKACTRWQNDSFFP